jgi:F-type H+-transporting ATPase subunit delta
MIESTLVKIYAEALFQIAEENDVVSDIHEELLQLEILFGESATLSAFLTSPKVDVKEKKQLIKKVLGPHFSPLIIHFLFTLSDKNRELIIPYMANEFKEILDRIHNRIDVDITSAVPLQESVVQRIKDNLSATLGKEIILHSNLDPSIIAGIIIRVEDRILDGSTHGYLRRLKARLLGHEIRRVATNENSA